MMRNIVKRLFVSLLFMTVLVSSQTALAGDCGFPPADPPPLPNGDKATRESMDSGVKTVRAYSTKMNAYFDCLQIKRDEWFYNMDRDQQARWIEDFNEIVDHLTEIETEMNRQIRVFNNRPS